MRRHARFLYQPVVPLGPNGTLITGCKAHVKLAKEAAIEGTVLLKNDGTLPLAQGTKICLFGRGAGEFQFGGGGSGNVPTAKTCSLAQGLMDAAVRGEIEFFSKLVDFYSQAVQTTMPKAGQLPPAEYRSWERPLPVLPEDLYREAVEFGGVALFCVSRYSSEGTKDGDRSGGKGDFYLWDEEQELLDRLCRDFEKVVVVLNVCGPVSTLEYKNNSQIGAVLYPMFGGSSAGEVLAEILLGKRYPSGHLQDTLAVTIDDYPSTETFREDMYYVNYTEDIFVGYRYFETFRPEAVVYPFGFGLGYTTFSISNQAASLDKNTVHLAVRVKNTGSHPGKEVIQAYLTAPQGKLGKAKKVLCAFGKTKELQSGEETILKLSFDIREFGSFDDLGKITKSAFILEKGEYTVSVGNNVRDTEGFLTFTLTDDILCRRCHSYMAPRLLKQRLTADGTMEPLPQGEKVNHPPKGIRLRAQAPEKNISLAQALEEDRMDEFLASLSDTQLTQMLYGHPVLNAADTNGIGLQPTEKRDIFKIPAIPTADGPAGLRAYPGSGVSPTYLPCANTVSQTWNLKLAQRVAAAGAKELKENNQGIWLSPALNIHRSPLCGRNFEYYSEDPLVSGLFAASNVKGVQSQNIAATIKHFCCNNKEVNRKESDSRVSERALREIYLRGFEICIKKAKPWALMTSYNLVNGEQSSSNWDAINGILRGEWKYDGVVMTDWWAFSNIEDEIAAGSDVKMPEMITYIYPNAPKQPYDLADKLASGELDRGAVLASVRRILQLMGHLE